MNDRLTYVHLSQGFEIGDKKVELITLYFTVINDFLYMFF
jgi:hypothetical protein